MTRSSGKYLTYHKDLKTGDLIIRSKRGGHYDSSKVWFECEHGALFEGGIRNRIELLTMNAPYQALVIPVEMVSELIVHKQTGWRHRDEHWTGRLISTMVKDGLLIPIKVISSSTEYCVGKVGLIWNCDGRGANSIEFRPRRSLSRLPNNVDSNDEQGHLFGGHYQVIRG